MNDSLRYLAEDPINRRYHHNEMTFAMVYQYSENFVLPISHDEVVHGKGSMMNKVPGDDWQKFATLRAFYSYMWAFPGKQLMFMGNEFGQRTEFNEASGLEWHVADMWGHNGLKQMFRVINGIYRSEQAFWELDSNPAGFEWLNADDAGANVYSWLRRDSLGSMIACFTNFSPVPRENYWTGLPQAGVWKEIFNSDAAEYDGTGMYGNLGQVVAAPQPGGRFPASTTVVVPPLATVWFKYDPAASAEEPGTGLEA